MNGMALIHIAFLNCFIFDILDDVLLFLLLGVLDAKTTVRLYRSLKENED